MMAVVAMLGFMPTPSEAHTRDDGLLFATYLGGSDGDSALSTTVNPSGNIYVTGETSSADFPLLSALDTTLGGPWDAFVAKFSPQGALLYSTYLGGTGGDRGFGIAADAAGNAYVVGDTWSRDFPTTPGAYDRTHGGGFDVFAVKLDPSGQLLYGTYLGGGGAEYAYRVAVDNRGEAFVTGNAGVGFPTTPGAFDRTTDGDDAFVAKLTPEGGLAYSTFLGGRQLDRGVGIAVDPSGRAWVAGETISPDFPTPHAFEGSFGGSWDAFAARLDPSGSTLEYGTYIGGADLDLGYSISFDASEEGVVVSGLTRSADFPVTPGSFDSTYNGDWDAFAVRLSAVNGSLEWGGFLGGSGDDRGYAVDVDSAGGTLLAGYAGSVDFPTTSDAFDRSYNGGGHAYADGDAYAVRVDSGGGMISYGSFFGGSNFEAAWSASLGPAGEMVLAGVTYSIDFPTTDDAPDRSLGGFWDAYVAVIMPRPSTVSSSLRLEPRTLSLKSSGRWATAQLSFDDSLAALVDPASLRLQGVPAVWTFAWRDDSMMAKFDRGLLAERLAAGEKVEVCLTGALTDGRTFRACDTIRVLGQTDDR